MLPFVFMSLDFIHFSIMNLFSQSLCNWTGFYWNKRSSGRKILSEYTILGILPFLCIKIWFLWGRISERHLPLSWSQFWTVRLCTRNISIIVQTSHYLLFDWKSAATLKQTKHMPTAQFFYYPFILQHQLLISISTLKPPKGGTVAQHCQFHSPAFLRLNRSNVILLWPFSSFPK